jgi:hypothetical protein
MPLGKVKMGNPTLALPHFVIGTGAAAPGIQRLKQGLHYRTFANGHKKAICPGRLWAGGRWHVLAAETIVDRNVLRPDPLLRSPKGQMVGPASLGRSHALSFINFPD